MANLEGKLSQKGDAIYLTVAELYLQALNTEMQKAKGQSLSVKQGYMSKYDLIDELRHMLKDKTTKPDGVKDAEWSEIQPLLEPTKSIEDIGKDKESYNKLQDFMNNLASQKKGLFNPTLANPFKTDTHTKVFPVPSPGAFDPRRHGRLLMVGKITDPGVKKWLINNSPLYGFVMYEDYGLYFSGLGEIKAKGSDKTKLAKLINQFQLTPIPLSDINLTTATLAAAEDALGIAFDPIIQIPDGTVDNKNNKPDLVRVDNNTMSKKIFDDYRAMFIAAKSAGITIIVGSGFRPATTGGTWRSQSGKTGTFTSQVGCRRDNLKRGASSSKSANGKWGQRSGMDWILYYSDSSTHFDPQTAMPGSSNHGSGFAVDLNTGKNNAAKNSPVYKWLAHNSWKYGFVRGVSTEEWHYEHLQSIKHKKPISPFDIVPQSNAKWYDIFANGISGTGGGGGGGAGSCEVLMVQGFETPDTYGGKAIAKATKNKQVSMNKWVRNEILPLLESTEFKNKYTKGLRMFALVKAIKEGYTGGSDPSRSYRTKNPGNIGNTDNGSNSTQTSLKAGLTLLLEYIKGAGNGTKSGWNYGPKTIPQYYSDEIANNLTNYARPSGCLPGYTGNYRGQLGFFTKKYATFARVNNNTITSVKTIFKLNSYASDIDGNTLIPDLVAFNNNTPIKLS